MKWFLKAMMFQVLARAPGGQQVYHRLQRVTGSSEQTQGRLAGKIDQTLQYWKWLEQNTPAEWRATTSHLDFGTGWLPSVPIVFYSLGVSRQYLVDIERHMQPEAVVRTIEMFRAVAPQSQVKFARMPAVPPDSQQLETTLESLGMVYAAPYDQLAEQIAGKVGFVTATHMLLHLNRDALGAVLRTIYRLLEPGGYFMALLHLRQLFDGLYARTSPFFALRYSDWFWENIINSRMMSYNRLKPRDYQEALVEAGFEIALLEVEPGTAEDSAQLERARIHPVFAKYSREELAARHLFLVARKPL